MKSVINRCIYIAFVYIFIFTFTLPPTIYFILNQFNIHSLFYVNFISYFISFLLIFPVYFKILKSESNEKFNKYNFFKYFIISYFFIFILNYIFSFIYTNIFNLGISANETGIRAMTNTSSFNSILMFFMTVIIAPIFEELFFRYVLFKQILKKSNLPIAIFISSFAFGFIHVYQYLFSGDFSQLIYLFQYACIGGIMCFLYYKFDNIKAPIALHMFNNFVSFVLMIGTM